MTTKAAEELYLAQHRFALQDRGYVVYNPNNHPIESLPIIYGFNNGGSDHWYDAVLISEDGTCLGGHVCSHEGYMEADLGILEGTRLDRHEEFKKYYPLGYRMDFVPYKDVKTHPQLNRAFKLNKEKKHDLS